MDEEGTIFVCVWVFDHSNDQMLGFRLNEINFANRFFGKESQSSSLMEQIAMNCFKMAAVIFNLKMDTFRTAYWFFKPIARW